MRNSQVILNCWRLFFCVLLEMFISKSVWFYTSVSLLCCTVEGHVSELMIVVIFVITMM